MYYIIYGIEQGIKFKQFDRHSSALQFLQDMFSDAPVKFLERFPDDDYDFYDGCVLVIKGDFVIPKPVEIVKTFEME